MKTDIWPSIKRYSKECVSELNKYAENEVFAEESADVIAFYMKLVVNAVLRKDVIRKED